MKEAQGRNIGEHPFLMKKRSHQRRQRGKRARVVLPKDEEGE